MSDQTITIERRYRANLADLWRLWTTASGLESWWGPPGFRVTVQSLDLRPGGKLHYTMKATAPEMIAFMAANGMPSETVLQVTYDKVSKPHRLAYRNLVDFVPGRAAYETRMAVDFAAEGEMAHLCLTFDAMHDAVWSERARMGWHLELDKLAAVIAPVQP